MPIQTMPAGLTDQPFLYQLYASTRQAELDAWGWDAPARDAFLQMQWRAQSLAYAQQYPGADHRIIRVDGEPAGRLLCLRSETAHLLVDIALLPAFRGHGLGTQLLRNLQRDAETEGKPLRLHVLKTNPARRFYLRLGFTVTADDGVYEQMEWRSQPSADELPAADAT